MSETRYVIFGESDAPILSNVAIVTGYEAHGTRDVMTVGQYLFPEKGFESIKCKSDGVVPVERFGVSVLRTPNRIYAVRLLVDSFVTYRDGTPRRWQERLPMSAKLPEHNNTAFQFSIGDFVLSALEARGMDFGELASIWNADIDELVNVIEGRQAVDEAYAARIAETFSTTKELWLNLGQRSNQNRR